MANAFVAKDARVEKTPGGVIDAVNGLIIQQQQSECFIKIKTNHENKRAIGNLCDMYRKFVRIGAVVGQGPEKEKQIV